MRTEHDETSDAYRGKGWDLVRLNNWPEWIVAPLATFGSLILLCLLAVGISIIFALVQRVWRDGTDTVQAASAALTAIAAIFGAAFLTWRTIVAHWQARASQEQAVIQRETLYTTLFTKAVEQLGATREIQKLETDKTTDPPTVYSTSETEPNLEVRLGAIYALERISRDSEKDHRPILEVLCAYIRNHQNCGKPTSADDAKANSRWPYSIPAPRVDVQAAVSVIGRRPASRIEHEKANDYYLDFTEANLQSAIFFRLSYPGSQFAGAHLENAQMQRADLNHCRFQNAILDGAGLGYATLDGAAFDLAHAKNAAFVHCSLRAVSFGRAKLDGTEFSASTLDKSYFWEASLVGAKFDDASLQGTIFARSDLVGASFRGANFSAIENEQEWRPIKSIFDESVLFEADFSQATGLKSEHLIGSFGDISTILPSNVSPPDNWPKVSLSAMDRIEYQYSKNG